VGLLPYFLFLFLVRITANWCELVRIGEHYSEYSELVRIPGGLNAGTNRVGSSREGRAGAGFSQSIQASSINWSLYAALRFTLAGWSRLSEVLVNGLHRMNRVHERFVFQEVKAED
jgi:hypothetical protein